MMKNECDELFAVSCSCQEEKEAQHSGTAQTLGRSAPWRRAGRGNVTRRPQSQRELRGT